MRPRLARWYLALFYRQVDLLLSLADAATPLLRERWPQLRATPVRVVPHGDYAGVYPAGVPAGWRDGIPDGARILLAFGQVRRYKNLPALVHAFAAAAPADTHLLVVGGVKEAALQDELCAAAAEHASVHLRLEVVPDERVGALLAAADVVLLPYLPRSALHSGAAMLALTWSRPVVVSDSPVMAELAAAVGPGWVTRTDGSPEGIVAAALAAAAQGPPPPPRLGRFAWPEVARLTVAAYHVAVEERRRHERRTTSG